MLIVRRQKRRIAYCYSQSWCWWFEPQLVHLHFRKKSTVFFNLSDTSILKFHYFHMGKWKLDFKHLCQTNMITMMHHAILFIAKSFSLWVIKNFENKLNQQFIPISTESQYQIPCFFIISASILSANCSLSIVQSVTAL